MRCHSAPGVPEIVIYYMLSYLFCNMPFFRSSSLFLLVPVKILGIGIKEC